MIVALAAIVLMLWIIVGLGKILLGALNLYRSDGGTLEADPMFAQKEALQATRPPDLSEDAFYDGISPEATASEDPSVAWSDEIHTPVDMTAEELAREADAQAELQS